VYDAPLGHKLRLLIDRWWYILSLPSGRDGQQLNAEMRGCSISLNNGRWKLLSYALKAQNACDPLVQEYRKLSNSAKLRLLEKCVKEAAGNKPPQVVSRSKYGEFMYRGWLE
jgi:hypothetical protein